MKYARKRKRGHHTCIQPISVKGFAKELLMLLAQGGGMMALTALCGETPGALAPLARFSVHGIGRVRLLVKRLQKQRYLTCTRKGREELIRITAEGAQRAAWYSLRALSPTHQTWDGIWRIVLFDVPNEAQLRRHFLRRELQHYGFLALQKSVYVHPHPCEEFVDLVAEACALKKCMLLIEAKSLGDKTQAMMKYFKLSN